ncbi:MAG: Hsp20 family protein [Alphaproteobacteria bacterium]|nr:Hsp20 family protein [Alphaproteobacteria bacterium]MBP7729153.1 Hsp20 family protein [Alphaproteobacteria bacterium]
MKYCVVKVSYLYQRRKQLKKEEKSRNFYCIERSYGSFQRGFSLPEDTDQRDY